MFKKLIVLLLVIVTLLPACQLDELDNVIDSYKEQLSYLSNIGKELNDKKDSELDEKLKEETEGKENASTESEGENKQVENNQEVPDKDEELIQEGKEDNNFQEEIAKEDKIDKEINLLEIYNDIKCKILNNSSFIMNRYTLLEGSMQREFIYYSSEYLYKDIEITTDEITLELQRLYLLDGSNYVYDGAQVQKNKDVDFYTCKNTLFLELFDDSFIWQDDGEKLTAVNGNYSGTIILNLENNKLDYKIEYKDDIIITYSGDLSLNILNDIEINTQLKKYINKV